MAIVVNKGNVYEPTDRHWHGDAPYVHGSGGAGGESTGPINVVDFGALPSATAAVNTVAIQTAINAAYARGGGTVVVPFVETGVYEVSDSAESDTWFQSGDVPAAPVSASFSLILRSGVMLALDQGVIIHCINRHITIVGAIDMDGGGITGGYLRGVADFDTMVTGAGHGIMVIESAYGNSNENMVFSGIEVSHVGSYGLSAQYGDYNNNRYHNIYIHDVGADAIDHKVRYGTTNSSRGISFDNIFLERFGLRVVGSAGLDLRGPATVSNYHAINFDKVGQANVGIRFSSSTYTAHATYPEYRETSSYASLTNFYINGGDPRVTQTIGVITYASDGPNISNGSIRNCDNGVYVYLVPSVNLYNGTNCKITNVQVEGCFQKGFYCTAPETTLINCVVTGQRDRFSEDQGTLIAGQTVFTPPRKYDIASVQVYKNDVLLATPANYTATDGIVVTLTAPVLATDYVDVVTPTVQGYRFDGNNSAMLFCRARYTTAPYAVTGPAAPTFHRTGNMFGTGSLCLEEGDAASPTLRPIGPGTNYNVDIQPKGTGTTRLYSRGVIIINAQHPATPVNYFNVIGSVTGQPVQVTLSGDTNCGMVLTARGTGAMYLRGGKLYVPQPAQTHKTDGILLTADELLAGIVTTDAADNAADSYQLPTASNMDTAGALGTNDAFDFSVINIGTNAAETVTLTTNTGWTLVGNMAVQANSAATAVSSGRFRARRTGGAAYTLYRIA